MDNGFQFSILTSARVFRNINMYASLLDTVNFDQNIAEGLLKVSRNLRDYLSSCIFQGPTLISSEFIGVRR